MRSVFVGSITGLLAVLVLTGTAYALAAVPEMDPGGGLTAITLLAGLAALTMERLRRK
jgi:hypothetical protein